MEVKMELYIVECFIKILFQNSDIYVVVNRRNFNLIPLSYIYTASEN